MQAAGMKTRQPSNRKRVQAELLNLSQGGILIDAGTGLKSGDPVRLSFRLPVSNDQIDAMGTIVWTSETRQGIRFTKLSDPNARALKDFIIEVEQAD